MITFKWLHGGTFQVLQDGKKIAIIDPSTKKETRVSFESNYKGNRKEERDNIIGIFFENLPEATAIA